MDKIELKKVWEIEGMKFPISISPDSKYLVGIEKKYKHSCEKKDRYKKIVSVYNLETFQRIKVIDLDIGADCISYDYTKNKLIVSYANEVYIYENYELKETIELNYLSESIFMNIVQDFSDGGKILNAYKSKIFILDKEDFKVLDVYDVSTEFEIRSMILSPNDKYIAYSEEYSDKFYILDRELNETIEIQQDYDYSEAKCFSQNGKYLGVSVTNQGFDTDVFIYDIEKREIIEKAEYVESYPIAFTLDDKYLIVKTFDKRIVFLDTKNWKVVPMADNYYTDNETSKFTPNGKYLILYPERHPGRLETKVEIFEVIEHKDIDEKEDYIIPELTHISKFYKEETPKPEIIYDENIDYSSPHGMVVFELNEDELENYKDRISLSEDGKLIFNAVDKDELEKENKENK